MPDAHVETDVQGGEREEWVEPELVVTSLKNAMTGGTPINPVDGVNTYS